MNSLSLFNPSFASDVFDAFDRDLGIFSPLASVANSSPKADVRETDHAYIMDIDLPGHTESDVDISLKDKILTITSIHDTKKETNKKEEGVGYLIRERRSSSFTRRFTLPDDIDPEKVEAIFKNGVLTITIPRQEETKARSIMIRSA